MRDPSGCLIGREPMLEGVLGALRQRRSVLLQGPAGIGKTALARQACLRLGRADRVDRLMAGPAAAGHALGTLAQIIPPDLNRTTLSDLRAGLFTRWRRRGAGEEPALVWVDDAHHVDPYSAAMLRQAVAAGVVQLLLTRRDAEDLPADLQALRIEGSLSPIDVPGLGRDAVLALIDTAAPALEEQQRTWIAELADGNPLFTLELCRLASTTDRAGAWRGLGSLVGRPVNALTPEQRRVLELVAAAEPAPVALFAPMVEHLTHLLRVGLVEHQGDDRVRVDHPLRAAWALERLGPLRRELHRELLDLAEGQGLLDELDPLLVLDWHLLAERPAEPARAEVATRRAIDRGDAATALRFSDVLTGDAARLLRGQALTIGGDLGAGLDLLDEVRRQADGGRRAEAASWLARYVGVMQGDYARAHTVLDDLTDIDDVAAQRYLWLARMWLWIFGPSDSTGLDALVPAVRASSGPDPISCELLTCVTLLYEHLGRHEDAAELLSMIAMLEEQVDLGDAARARLLATRAGHEIAGGNGLHAIRMLESGLRAAVHLGDVESATLLAGNACLFLALSGRPRRSLTLTETLSRMPDDLDWFQYRRLAQTVQRGNAIYAGRTPGKGRDCPPGRGPDPADDLDAVPLVTLLALFDARARHLAQEASGTADGSALRRGLTGAGGSGRGLYAGFVACELMDLNTPQDLLELMVGATAGATAGLLRVCAATLGARLGRCPAQLVDAGLTLESYCLPTAASRAMADVLRLTDDPGLTTTARRAIARAMLRWDGGRMWWLEDLAGLPTRRQLQVARAASAGHNVARIAEQLTLSRRTVENHLYRVGRALSASGVEELTVALDPPGRPGQEPR